MCFALRMGIIFTLRKDRALLQECDFPCNHVGLELLLLGEGAEGGVELGLVFPSKFGLLLQGSPPVT